MLAPYRSDVGKTSSVGSHAEIGYLRSYLFFCYIIQRIFKFSLHIRELIRKMFENVFLYRILTSLSFKSVESIKRIIKFVACILSDFGVKILGYMIKLDLLFFFTADSNDFFDKRALFFNLFVSEKYRADHIVVGKFFCSSLNHHYGIFSSGKVERKSAVCLFCDCRIDNILTVNHTYDHGSGRTCPRNVRNAERNRRTEHCKRLGCYIRIDRKRSCHNSYVIEQPLGEKRSYRSVYKSGYENGFIASPAFSFLEPAGNFTDGIHLFFVIDGQRKEIHTLSGYRCHCYIDHHYGFAASDNTRTVGLLSVLTDVNGNLFPTYRRCKYFVIF